MAEVTNDERVQRYAEAIREAMSLYGEYDVDDQVERVMAVADAEQAEMAARVERRHELERWQRARAQVAEAKVARVEALLDRLEGEPRAVCFSGASFDPILTTGDVRAALDGEVK